MSGVKLNRFTEILELIEGEGAIPTEEEKLISQKATDLAEKYLFQIADGVEEGIPVIYLNESNLLRPLSVSLSLGDANIGRYRNTNTMQIPLVVQYVFYEEEGGVRKRNIKTLTTYEPSIKVKEDRLIEPPTKNEIRIKILAEFASRYLNK